MMMSATPATDRMSSWVETQYCASVAATLLARKEYFELLEDAMVSPVRLVRALSIWKLYANLAHVHGGMVGSA
ncbi:MAG: hypothetical protein JWN85_165 [Gammaproteobacteria bacterium]|nr:hypothetical protein [Gammaproteobacteria bacterium]